MFEPWQTAGFGLYIHWPFCAAKCPYCDFNSHVVDQIDQSRWAKAYCAEIERIGSDTHGRTLRSVFFGGGTPSLMDQSVVESILSKIRDTWACANDFEITLEANPTSVEAGRFAGYRAAGVNRVSLGVQALNDQDLKRLGRLHSAKEALVAVDIANQTFDRVSFDLIYARQHQSTADWIVELQEALNMKPTHLSLYQLTIEPDTAFGDRYARGRLPGLPSDDLGADLYEITQDYCADAGLPAYEVSNHAKPGEEGRHNLIYWQSGDYAGIGPGAHGRLTLSGQRYATDTPLAPAEWLKRVESLGDGELQRDAIDAEDQLVEKVMMGLRLSDGIELATDELPRLTHTDLAQLGFIEIANNRMRVTPKGRPVLNGILRELLANF